MPLNEAARFKRSHDLTPEEEREQTAACFGIRLQPDPSYMDLNNLSPEELAMMRVILAQHANGTTPANREIDINNPPVPRYTYQEYPRIVYQNGQSKPVNNPDELAKALSDGWTKIPGELPAAAPVAPPDAQEAAEIAALDAIAKKPVKK